MLKRKYRTSNVALYAAIFLSLFASATMLAGAMDQNVDTTTVSERNKEIAISYMDTSAQTYTMEGFYDGTQIITSDGNVWEYESSCDSGKVLVLFHNNGTVRLEDDCIEAIFQK